MKDYTLIIDTINTAEAMLKDYDNAIQKEIKTRSKDALDEVAEYLWAVLRDVEFANFDIVEHHSWVKAGDGIPLGEMNLHSGSRYLVAGTTYKAQLFISSSAYITRIYFNENNYIIQGGNYKPTQLYLCYYWKQFKNKIEPAIDRALEARNKRIKEALSKTNMEKYIVDNFEI